VRKEKPIRTIEAKRVPSNPEPEQETPASLAISSTLTPPIDGGFGGEFCAADFGGLPRLSLVAPTSAVADEITPGQWALSNGLGPSVVLGNKIEIIPLACGRWWLMDFGQAESGTLPVRFKTEREVHDYGGTVNREPGKVTFSRSMEIRCLITGAYNTPETYLRLSVGSHQYLVALYEASRTAYRIVGVGLNLTLLNSNEKPWQRKWKLGVATRKNKALGTTFFVPILENSATTTAAEQAELVHLIERQLPS
jgi:hypothetical protein